MFHNMLFHKCHPFPQQEHFLHIFCTFISNLRFGYLPGTKSHVETHGFLGRQPGQANGSGQEAAETYVSF